MKKVFQTAAGLFGGGTPLVCVPIVAKDQEGIWKKAEEIRTLPADIVEWRADFYTDVKDSEKVADTLGGLKKRLKGKSLLFTLRTRGEGGNLELSPEACYRLNREAAGSGYADLIDVEAYLDPARTAEEIQKLHELPGIHVIASSHDFGRTPLPEEMLDRLRQMEAFGADVAKLAVMPNNRQDVLNLLQAALWADEELSIPTVTMSMGSMGVVSRICGRLTGSAMTFAAAGQVSAPGQIPVAQMGEILKITG